MKKLVRMLMAAGLLICAAPYGRTDPLPNVARTDKLANAKAAEEKGDLARAHNDYEQAVSCYLSALRVERQNADLYNKLGVAELKLGCCAEQPRGHSLPGPEVQACRRLLKTGAGTG